LHYTASEQRGRRIYSREGCAYCHTQQIRYLDRDTARFGAPTLAWETQFDFPHLWGTRRIGPDLSREGAVRPEDWQFSHLYAPRSVVADSVMPPYAALFDGAPDRPTQEGRDLVAYLMSLGRARDLATTDAALNNNPAKARREGPFPALAVVKASPEGERLMQQNCQSCHGRDADGKGPGAAGLQPKPRDLASHEYTTARLSRVLWNGVAGTAMPAWRDFSDADRSRLAAQVRALHDARPEPDIPASTLELGRTVYKDRCAQCHGENGGGDGSAAKEQRIAPADFRTGRPSIAASLSAVRDGVPGTPMAPWSGKLSEAEVSAVAYYVRTFYAGDPQ
jgi:cbb3-type cytochrome oxidase cytochrome c subunit